MCIDTRCEDSTLWIVRLRLVVRRTRPSLWGSLAFYVSRVACCLSAGYAACLHFVLFVDCSVVLHGWAQKEFGQTGRVPLLVLVWKRTENVHGKDHVCFAVVTTELRSGAKSGDSAAA